MANRIKTATFTDKDRELVTLIEKYGKSKGLSFIGAIRELCTHALTLKKITK